MKSKITALFAGVLMAASVFSAGLSVNAASSSASNTSVPGVSKERTYADEKKMVYVPASWAKEAIDGKKEDFKNPVIVEASWGTMDEAEDYKKGHIPGAIHQDTSSIEDEPYWNLRSPEEVEKALLAAGITKDTPVLIYSSDISAASRVAYAYLWAGVEDVKIIDGGYKAWTDMGYPTETEIRNPVAVIDFGAKVPVHPEYWMSVEDAKEKLESGDENFRLVSIRSYVEFDGETSGYSYIEKAGEPKGAVWGKAGSDPSHMEDYTHEDGTAITMDEMKDMWKDLQFSDKNEIAFYCGTGWRATIPFLIMYENGYDNMTLYDGGWFQWQMMPDYPVQVGDPAKGNVEYKTVKDLPDGKSKQD